MKKHLSIKELSIDSEERELRIDEVVFVAHFSAGSRDSIPEVDEVEDFVLTVDGEDFDWDDLSAEEQDTIEEECRLHAEAVVEELDFEEEWDEIEEASGRRGRSVDEGEDE